MSRSLTQTREGGFIPEAGKDVVMDEGGKMRELNLGGVEVEEGELDLATIGFFGRVTDETREALLEDELRASRVLTTAARFAFR